VKGRDRVVIEGKIELAGLTLEAADGELRIVDYDGHLAPASNIDPPEMPLGVSESTETAYKKLKFITAVLKEQLSQEASHGQE
jgi:hypothetical protein